MTNYVDQTVQALAARLPDCGPDLLHLYALLAPTKGRDTTLKDVHDAWATWRNVTRPDHPSLVPFEDLTPEVQEMDRAYAEAIHAVAA